MLGIIFKVDDEQKEAQILSVLMGGATQKTEVKKEAPKKDVVKDEEVAEEETEEKKAPKKPAAKKEEKKAPAKAKADASKYLSDEEFESFDEEEQFETFKIIATRHSKKGKTADIKKILEKHGVARMTELEPDQYLAFYQDVVRYDQGDDIDEICEDGNI